MTLGKRGNNPDIGKIKSPGRPRNLKKFEDIRVYREDVLKAHMPDLLHVMLDDAIRRKNPKTAQALIEMLYGKPTEPKTDRNDALHIFLHGLQQANNSGQVVTVTPEVLPPGPKDDPGTKTD